MHGRAKTIWSLMALACLLATSPGCVIRRGWVVKCDWSFEAHRTGCRHRWFQRRCQRCPTSCDETDGGCGSCSSCRGGGLGGLLHGEEGLAPPPAPEPPGPSTFHPVPTRPIYGGRSEEPDAYAAPMRPIAPQPLDAENPEIDGEPIDESDPPPIELDRSRSSRPDDAAVRPKNVLRASGKVREVRTVSWQTARPKRAAASASSQCPSCTVRFRD